MSVQSVTLFSQPPTPRQIERICKRIFGLDLRDLDLGLRSEYLEFISSEFATIRNGLKHGKIYITSIPLTEITQLEEILQALQNQSTFSLREITQSLRNTLQLTHTVPLDQAVYFGARLLYMLNVQTIQFQSLTPGTRVLPWSQDLNIHEFLARQFPKSDSEITYREGRLQPYFTAANMDRICGLKIQWTDSLEDHLRLDRRIPALRVFPHKRWLLQMLNIQKDGSHCSKLPERLLKETIQSLDLLFPHWDKRTQILLRKERMSFHHRTDLGGSRQLNLRDFVYWRERLLEIYEEVFLSPPATWAQLWSDRRNPQQWLTFWLALFIALLTLASTVATIVQTWASLRGP